MNQRFSTISAALLLLVVLSVCLVVHLSGLGGSFLSDDFPHARIIANAQYRGELLSWLLDRFYLPLSSGNFAYRPVVFASYALDWVLYGVDAWGWHLSNLLIHLVNASLVLVLTLRLTRLVFKENVYFVAFTTTSLFLAIPFAGETTFWPVGRFDLLACLFSLLFLHLLTGISAQTRFKPLSLRYFAMLICLLLALLSKESAMPMLAVGLALLFALRMANRYEPGITPGVLLPTTFKETMARYWPVLLMALFYFAWRFWIFGSAWKVYDSSFFPGPSEFFLRISALKYVFIYPWAGLATLWWLSVALAGGFWLLGLNGAIRRSGIPALFLTLILFLCFACYLLAPATSFAIASANGEGIRNLYFPWMLFSLFIGFALARHRFSLYILGITIVISLWGQWRMVDLWQDAASQMLRITTAIPELAESIPDQQFALLLLADNVNGVPFARSAQGSIVRPPIQSVSYLPVLAPMIPKRFVLWEKHLQTNVIGTLRGTGVEFDRSMFYGVYCWQPTPGRFHRLETMPVPGRPDAWEARTMDEASQAGCLLR